MQKSGLFGMICITLTNIADVTQEITTRGCMQLQTAAFITQREDLIKKITLC